MFSIFKGQSLKEEKRVIDSNDRILEKVEAYQQKVLEAKQQHREELLMELLDSLEPDEMGNYYLERNEDGEFDIPTDEDGEPLVAIDENGMLLPFEEEAEPEETEMEDEGEAGEEEPEEDYIDPRIAAREEADMIIANARLEAEDIVADATSQAEAIKSNAREEGRKDGFMQGQAQAAAELNEQRAALERQAAMQDAEYENRLVTMESEVVDMISDIIEKVFLVEFSDHRDITMHLIENAMMGAESSREFLIRVNEANFNYLTEHKAELQEKVGEGAKLDLIQDPLMDDAACIIETDGGVFDCGMDTQMRNLIKDIKALGRM